MDSSPAVHITHTAFIFIWSSKFKNSLFRVLLLHVNVAGQVGERNIRNGADRVIHVPGRSKNG